jgi:hypothetical protein
MLLTCISLWFACIVQADEKCDLPLQYLKESNEYQSNNNIKRADEYFDIGLSLHQLLVEKCDSSSYRESLNMLLKQHTVNQRALCSSGVRKDCFKNTNRMKKFDE